MRTRKGNMLQTIHSVSTLDRRVLPASLPDVFERFPDAVILVDGYFRITYLNPAAQQLLGLEPGNAQGHSLDHLLQLQDGATRKPVRVVDALVQDTVFPGTFHLLSHSSGGQIPVQYSIAPVPSVSGGSGGYVVSLRNASALQQYIDRLQAQTTHDDHTHLLRRAELIKRLWRVLQKTDDGEPQAFVYLDMDNFGAINDSAGHAAGDQAIRQIALRLRDVVRERDTLARLGGDEFGLLLERCPAELARERAAQLHRAVDSYVLRWNDASYRVGVSIGLAMFKTRNHSLNTILAAADAACSKAKRKGGAGARIAEAVLD